MSLIPQSDRRDLRILLLVVAGFLTGVGWLIFVVLTDL